MRKILLMIAAVFASITLAYAESCSSGQGSLSYQISGCGDQARACCTGQWCSWGTTSCATCNDTSTSTACSNVSSSYCTGTATATRSVTGSCGSSCSYGDWSSWNTGNCCGYYSCTDTSTSTACSNVSSSYCSGTATTTRSVSSNCCGCSYGGWASWNTSGCTSYASCNSRNYTSSTQAYGACGGSLVYNYYQDLSSSCGGCSYGGWVHYSSSDDRWGPYCSSGRDYTSSVGAYGSCGGSLVYYYYRDPSATCSGCSWPGWTHYNTTDDRWGPYCSEGRQYTSSSDSSGACSGSITYYYYRDPSATCSGCSWPGWTHYSTSDNRSWWQSCTATTDSTACSNVSSSYCTGTATRTRSVTNSCGSCSYSDWSGWDTSGCKTQTCTTYAVAGLGSFKAQGSTNAAQHSMMISKGKGLEGVVSKCANSSSTNCCVKSDSSAAWNEGASIYSTSGHGLYIHCSRGGSAAICSCTWRPKCTCG